MLFWWAINVSSLTSLRLVRQILMLKKMMKPYLFCCWTRYRNWGSMASRAFGKTLAGHDAVHRQIDRRHAGPARFVDELPVHEVAVGGQVDEEAIPAAVVDDLQDEILAD